MKFGKSLKNNYIDIFSYKSIPINNYSIKGDKNSEKEIQKVFLQKKSAKWNTYQKNNNLLCISFNPSLSNTLLSANEEKQILLF